MQEHFAAATQGIEQGFDAATVVDGKQWIRQGLAAGETVVVQGQSRIAPGLKVTPVNTDSTAELAQVAP